MSIKIKRCLQALTQNVSANQVVFYGVARKHVDRLIIVKRTVVVKILIDQKVYLKIGPIHKIPDC